MAESEYDEFEYSELQAEAKARNLPASGTTEDLVARLEADDADEPASTPEPTVTERVVADEEPDEDGFVGVSPEYRHKPASHHFSPNPGGNAEAEGDNEEA